MQNLTSIGWIGYPKTCGDEWSFYTKKFTLTKAPEYGILRADSYGVCSIYINGQFLDGSSGRFPNRILCVECTSLLHTGENEIRIKLGSHFYQEQGVKNKNRRGIWFSAVAAELKIRGSEEKTGEQIVVTDESWIRTSSDKSFPAERFSDVNRADYDRFWKAAAVQREYRMPKIPQAIVDVAGPEYLSYARKEQPLFAEPVAVVQDGMTESSPFIIYDFDRIQVGYIELEYEAEEDGRVCLEFDYTENPSDFDRELSKCWGNIRELAVTEAVRKGRNSLRLTRRRAARFVKITFFEKAERVKVHRIRFRLSMLRSENTGWFWCPDKILNEAWEVGKYTLQVNKHQEYESCPRSEMKYFSGDGIIDALIDYYAFGDDALVNASLAITEIDCNSGIQHNIHDRNTPLWDYPAWRIVMVYNQFRYYNDVKLVRRYYDELVLNTQWMIQKMNQFGLIYQYPVFAEPFYKGNDTVEYTCSFDRLGEKPYLNALLYKSLQSMSELAECMGDPRGIEWGKLAQIVKAAMNERLWDENVEAYLDTYDRSYVPQDGNALAVLFGIADEERGKQVLNTLCRENWSPYGSAILSTEKPSGSYSEMHTRGGSKTISPAMCMYEAEARFLRKDAKSALDLVHRCWGTMLQKGAKTFWEFAPNNGTDRWPVPSHAWSGGCTYLLSAYVLGIRPGKQGYETLHFEPYGGFEELKGVVPTAKGLVAVKGETISGKKRYTLCVPGTMEIEMVLPDGAEGEIVRYE